MKKIFGSERGIAMIEVIMAQLILIIAALAIWNVFVFGSRVNSQSEDRTTATNIARYKVEEIMNTTFENIVTQYPQGETSFESESQDSPCWVRNSEGDMVPALQDGKLQIDYFDVDPLRVRVTVSWRGLQYQDSSLSMETLVCRTSGRSR